jgi:hypothetical protein
MYPQTLVCTRWDLLNFGSIEYAEPTLGLGFTNLNGPTAPSTYIWSIRLTVLRIPCHIALSCAFTAPKIKGQATKL